MKENRHVECKQTWRDEVLRPVCPFAEPEGGFLEIGRNSNNRGIALGVPRAARRTGFLYDFIRTYRSFPV